MIALLIGAACETAQVVPVVSKFSALLQKVHNAPFVLYWGHPSLAPKC